MDVKYTSPGRIASQFLRSKKYFRGIRGPVGSGKSVLCAMQLFLWACNQQPNRRGIRSTRFGILRNTNPMLRNTTIKTWLDWFPEELYGTFRWSPPYTHSMNFADVECEVIFVALDREEDIAKLLSLELTAAWINEAREVAKGVVDALTARVGRYPSLRHGGPTNYGIIADTNSMDDQHWWPIMSGEAPVPQFITEAESVMLTKPPDWEFFTQPAAMLERKDASGAVTGYDINLDAENLKNLIPDYYLKIIQGKKKDWIDVYILNRLGSVAIGKPVYEGSFKRDVHVLPFDLQPVPDVPICVGMDFGLTPAAVFAQQLGFGRWRILAELCLSEMGARRFGVILKSRLSALMPNVITVRFTGDPAGDNRSETDEMTPYRILAAMGIHARPAPTNDARLRIEAVESCLNRLVDGKPGLEINPGCTTLIRGFESGYHYRRRRSAMGDSFEAQPDKNRFSHPHDALQYLLLGEGEGNRLFGNIETVGKAHNVAPHSTLWDRHRARLSGRRPPRLRTR